MNTPMISNDQINLKKTNLFLKIFGREVRIVKMSKAILYFY